MSNYEGIKYNFDGANLTGVEGIPTGTIVPWSDATVPSGFLECNGSNVSRTTYADLFAIIGTTYGAGDGSTTFGLPDLQDNVPVGKSGTKALGTTGGANTVTPTGNVGGSTANATLSVAQLAQHNHEVYYGNTSGNQGFPHLNTGGGVTARESLDTGQNGGHSHNMSATFTGDANSVLQPYLTLLYVIKT